MWICDKVDYCLRKIDSVILFLTYIWSIDKKEYWKLVSIINARFKLCRPFALSRINVFKVILLLVTIFSFKRFTVLRLRWNIRRHKSAFNIINNEIQIHIIYFTISLFILCHNKFQSKLIKHNGSKWIIHNEFMQLKLTEINYG